MKTAHIFYFLCALFVTTIQSQTNVSGALSSDTTWSLSNSPYTVTGSILIPNGVTLTIEAGAVINFLDDYKILVKGNIISSGTSESLITFNGNSSEGSSQMIIFKSTNLSNSTITHNVFNGPQKAIQLADESEGNEDSTKNSGILTVTYSDFNNAGIYTKGYSTSAELKFENSTFDDLTIKGYYPRTEPITFTNCVVNNSNINSDSYNYGIKFIASTVKNSNITMGCCSANFLFNASTVYNSTISNGGGSPVNGLFNVVNSFFILSSIDLSSSHFVSEKSIFFSENSADDMLSIGNTEISNSSFIGYNNTLNSTGIKISGRAGYNIGGNTNISNSTLLNFNSGLVFDGKNTISIANNNILSNSSYNVKNNTSSDLILENNFWGTVIESEIQDLIFDSSDDIDKGTVDYTPFSTALNTTAPISPPSNVIKAVSGSDLVLTWTENTESDLTGYKLYFGNPTGYSYSESIDLGNVTTHTIAGGDINNEFAITAYDSSIDGTDDMVDGNESWYSIANTVPELPSGVTIEAAPRKSRLNWTPSASSDINKYIIYRGTTTDPTEVLTEVIDPTAVFFVDTDLTQGSNYFYRIKSVSTAGVESDFSQNYSVAIPDSWIVSLTPGPLDLFGSIQNPYNTIQAAIDQSINGDAVVVYPGVYVENVSITEKVVSLTTPDPTLSAETTIIDGGANGYPVLTLNGGYVTHPEVDLILSGFTLRNGLSPTYTVPGGLHVHQWRPGITIKISNLIIEDNIATAGNSAAGSYFYYTPLIEVSDVIYRNNISASHSTFGAFNAPFSMDRCEFYNNTSPYRTLDFWQNEPRGFSTISNSLINNNIGGGGLYGMNAILLNTTIVDNGTQNLFRGSSAIVNTIIGSGQFISSDTGLLEVHNSYIEDGQNSIDIFPSFLTYENNLEGDIYFTDAENLDFTLSEYSPAIGSGINSINLYTIDYNLESYLDLNSGARPLPEGTNIDLGAYENSLSETVHNSEIYVSISDGSDVNSVGLQSAPFKTIQAAVDYSIDADNINVLPGVYQEQVIVANKGISLLSTVPLGAQINLLISSASLMTFTSNVDYDKVSTVEGFYLSGTGTEQSMAFSTNGHYLQVKNCKVIDFQSAMRSQVSAVEAINSLFVNIDILAFNDNCSTGPGPITPLIKNCTIIGSIVIHSACPSISIDIFNSIILKDNLGSSGYAAPPFFSKVLTNDVSIVPQSGSSFAVLPNSVEDIYFTDYTGGDYTLSEFSPALGYGAFPVSEDILGNSRPMPVGSSLDAGAFESSLGSPSNAVPRFGDIADISTNEDSGLHSINIIEIVDGDILSTQDLTFTVSSDNPSLFSLLEISYVQGENNAVLNYDTNLNQNGTANISVTLSDDGNGDPNIVNFVNKGFEISVFPVNDSPTDIFLSNQLLTENTINIPVALLTAEDIDDDAFSYELVPGVGDQNNSSFEIVGTDLRVVSPFDFENTLEAFVRLRVLDSQELTFEKEFVITIQDINDSPVANDQSITLDEDTLASVSLTANDQDNDPLTYTIVNQPTNGTAVLTANTIDYTPIGDYSGLDSFTFTVNDGTIDSNLATVSIDVLPVNDAPVASDQSVSTDEDTMIQITLVATDVDSAPLTYTIVNQPTNGTAVLTANTIDYTPDGDYSGLDSFTFTVNDGTIDSNLATVSIDVFPINDAPTSIEITSSSIVENVIASVGLISCVDPDADDVYAYELVVGSGDTNNNLFEIIGNELYNINPLNFETQELYTVRIKASNVNDEIEEVFPIQVTNVNDINIASQIQDSYCEGSTGDGQITITEINEVSGNVVFDWTGPNGFTSQDQSIINLEPGLYDLEVSDDFFTYSESFSVGLIPIYENLEICYVSGDSNEPTKNRIYLNKEGNYNVGAYKVFRETTIADQYQQIGLVLPTEDSFLDNNSNNLIRQYKYKVATLDNCGVESGFSEVHYNTFLQANLSSGGNVNLFWEPYFGLNYDSFYIYRSENGSTFEILAVLPSNQTVYNDISADVGSNDYSYYIGIIAEECTLPDPFNGGADTRTLPIIVQSNPLVIVDGSLGVTQMLYTGEISLYPNPASDQINIVCPEQLEFIKVELYNINGQYLGSNNFKNMSVSQLQGGVYFLKIYTKQGAFIKKIIKK